MHIHEYQAKEVLANYGIQIQPGTLVYSPDQAVAAYNSQGSAVCAVKAQIHSGARGKAGGIRLCRSNDEVRRAADEMLGEKLVTHQTGSSGKLVQKLYVEAGVDIDREIYLAFVLDRAKQRHVAVASAEGGMEIEQLAQEKPESILRISIDPASGMRHFQAQELAFGLGLGSDLVKQAVSTFRGLYKAMIELDASMVEINPLVVTRDRRLIALDAKMEFDDNALFRHREVAELRDMSQEDPRETAASDHDLSYVGLDGDIGCMINGAGLAMATMDMIKLSGGEPANFLDIGGGASPERVAKAFELVLQDGNVKAMLVNIFAGINRCDWIAEGLIKALGVVDLGVPLVVRLSGTNVEEGTQMLVDSGLPIIMADTLADAAQKAVAAAQGQGE
ncbi:MAG: malate--CoA ligase subunit beta [Gammaproteobacteria bacterium]|nr:malate--CoA ligase subunit beta [Gammaproteobacteria bacterium]